MRRDRAGTGMGLAEKGKLKETDVMRENNMNENSNAVKWRKTILAIFVTAGVFLLGSVWNARTEKQVESGPVQILETGHYALEEEAEVTQSFLAPYASLRSVSILPANLDEKETGSLLVSLQEENGEELCSAKVPLQSLRPGEFYEIPLEASLRPKNGYRLRFSSENILEYTPMLVAVEPQNAPAEEAGLSVGGEDREDSLALIFKYQAQLYTAFQDTQTRTAACFRMAVSGLLLLALLGAALLYVWLPPFGREVKAAVRLSGPLAKQWSFVLLWPSLFLAAAVIGGGSPDAAPSNKVICGVLAFVGLALSGGLARKAWKESKRGPLRAAVAEGVKRERWILLALAAAALPRLFMFTGLQRWDGGDYYSKLAWACERFLFNWGSYWERFRLNGHWALGSSLFLSLGEFLNPYGVKGALAVQLGLSLAAVACLYGLLRRWIGGLGRARAAAAAFLISCTPLFLGTFNYINMDYLLAVFFIFMLYAEAKQEYVLMAFWAVMLTQSKETGLFVAAGYLAARLLAGFALRRGRLGERLTGTLCERGNWAAFFTGLTVLFNLYLLGSFGEWAGDMTGIQVSVDRTNYFGLDAGFALHKLKQIFVLNFAWVCVLLLLLCFLWRMARRLGKTGAPAGARAGSPAEPQKDAVYLRRLQYAGIAGGLGAFLIFSCLYITSNLYRYDVIAVLALSVLAAAVYLKTFPKAAKGAAGVGHAAAGGIFLLLFLAQSFFDVDPVSNLAFRTLDIGGIPKNLSNYQSDYYGDGLVNNFQYMWLDDLFDKMLADCGFDADTAVILAGRQYSGTQVNGNGEKYAFAWDPVKQRRVMANTQKLMDGELPGLVEIRTETTGNLFGRFPWKYRKTDAAAALEQLPEKAVVFFLPYFKEDEELQLENLKAFYYIGERRIAKNLYGQIAFYSLRKKENYKGFSLEQFLGEQEQAPAEPMETLENYQYRYAAVGSFLEEREDIRQGDSVRFYLEAAAGGERVPYYLMESGNYLATPGDGTLLDGLGESLIGHKTGDRYEYRYRVPEGYPTAARFADKEILFTVTVLQNEGRRYIEDMDPETTEEMTAAYERKKALYEEEEAVRNAARQARQGLTAAGERSAAAVEEREQLDEYLASYLERCGLSEAAFRKGWLGCSEEELEAAKKLIARASVLKESS